MYDFFTCAGTAQKWKGLQPVFRGCLIGSNESVSVNGSKVDMRSGTCLKSANQVVNHVPSYVSQSIVAAFMAVNESLVIDT